jgi:hypothetical protein
LPATEFFQRVERCTPHLTSTSRAILLKRLHFVRSWESVHPS